MAKMVKFYKNPNVSVTSRTIFSRLFFFTVLRNESIYFMNRKRLRKEPALVHFTRASMFNFMYEYNIK